MIDREFWMGYVKEVDMIAARVPFLTTYREVLDFSIPLAQDNWVTLQKESSGIYSLFGLLTPFSVNVTTFFTVVFKEI